MHRIKAFLRHPTGMIGLVILLGVFVLAALAPTLFPDDPWDMVGAPFQPPLSEGLLLGSDTLGRDVAAGIAYGARVSLSIGITATAAAVLIGIVIGAIAGYFGDRVDEAMMRLTELFQTIPGFILAILLVATLGPTLGHVVLAIAAVSWPPVARLTRAEFLRLRGREFVEAAVCQGQPPLVVVLRHILPNALSPIIVTGSLTIATSILLESALSASRTVIRQAWWMSVFPGVAILLSVLAINLVGEGLNDILNPRIARKVRAA
jgi:peptide/nickel transport system permease protein